MGVALLQFRYSFLDLKLLDQHYVVDRTALKEEYRLNTPMEDEKLRAKLAKVVQKGAKSVSCPPRHLFHDTAYLDV